MGHEQPMIDEAKDSLSTHINDDASSEQVASNRLKEVEEENQKLRQRLWNLQYKGNVAIGIALLSIGGIALILSYVLSSLIVTFIGLGLVLWGILIFSASSSSRVHPEVVYAISTSITESLYDLLSNFDGKVRKVVFFYPNQLQGFTQGHIFVSFHDSEFRIPEDQARTFLDDPRGISIAAPGQGLVSLFEKELGINFATVDLDYIQQAMPGLLVDNLRIADDFLIEDKGDGIFLAKIVGDLPSRICKSNGKKIEHGSEFGCLICSSLALIISKFTGKPVVIRESQVKDNAVTSTFLALGVFWMVFAFSIWDLSLWVAGSSILMLIASEFISPYYGRMNTIIDQKKLRLFAVGFGITFVVFTIAKAISLQSS